MRCGDSYHVSKLLNLLVRTLPISIPRRSTIRCARSGCDVPLKTLMFGILLCKATRELSKFARNKLLARTGCDTGITATETSQAVRSVVDWCLVPDVTPPNYAPPMYARAVPCEVYTLTLSHLLVLFRFFVTESKATLSDSGQGHRVTSRLRKSLMNDRVVLCSISRAMTTFHLLIGMWRHDFHVWDNYKLYVICDDYAILKY